MGYIKHKAIVVTGSDKQIEKAWKKATKNDFLKGLTSELISGKSNMFKSFFIAPDGSKEGWEPANVGYEEREKYTNWLLKHKDELFLEWVEVHYGFDYEKATVEKRFRDDIGDEE